VILYSLIISFSIEVYQTIFTYFGLTMFRQFNVDDILLNTLGAILGFYICIFIIKQLRSVHKSSSPSSEGTGKIWEGPQSGYRLAGGTSIWRIM